MQMVKMMTLTMLPTLALLVMSIVDVQDTAKNFAANDAMRSVVTLSMEVSDKVSKRPKKQQRLHYERKIYFLEFDAVYVTDSSECTVMSKLMFRIQPKSKQQMKNEVCCYFEYRGK